MEELEIVRKTESKDRVHSLSQDDQSMLLVKENGMEVIRYSMPRGLVGNLSHIEEGGIETYFVIDGSLKLKFYGKEELIEQGDCFVLDGTEKDIPFYIVEDSSFIVFTNRNAYEESKNKTMKLNVIMNELQKKDEYTKDHCERVKNLCVGMIHYIDFDFAKVDNLFLAARFHDIGKISIPLELLKKEGKYTEEEYEIMKGHSRSSYDIVNDTFGKDIANIVLQHHERIDGKGYPQGLSGEEILEEAKIIAVAEAYDAMTSSRYYFQTKTSQEALEEIKRCIGTQFDKECVNALVQYLEKERTEENHE